MSRQELLTAVLVGKSILLREGLAKILRAANFRILSSVSCADELRIGKPLPKPVLFLVVHTGDDFDTTLEQIELSGQRYPEGRIAVVADRYQPNELVSAFRAGANGYFVNVITCDRFIKAVELVSMGETIYPPALLSFILGADSPKLVEAALGEERGESIHLSMEGTSARSLSPREKLILQCLVEGDSNKCIARKIDITEATVKVHVKAILRKIRVHNRTQAAIWGMNNAFTTRPANGSPRPPVSNGFKGFADPVKLIPEI